MGRINGVSDQFVEDINVILDEYENNELVRTILNEIVIKFFFKEMKLILFENFHHLFRACTFISDTRLG